MAEDIGKPLQAISADASQAAPLVWDAAHPEESYAAAIRDRDALAARWSAEHPEAWAMFVDKTQQAQAAAQAAAQYAAFKDLPPLQWPMPPASRPILPSFKSVQRGWMRDAPDDRDRMYEPSRDLLDTLPPWVDLRPYCPPVYDQGAVEDCTSNAVAAAVQVLQTKAGKPTVRPSSLFIYHNSRQLDAAGASGSTTRSAIKAVVKMGLAPYEAWPDGSDLNTPPGPEVFAAAKTHMVTGYSKVRPRLAHLKACLAEGYPFIFGLRLFPSWDTNRTADVPLPTTSELSYGGHALLAVGYDDTAQRFLFRNSWSAQWGYGGYGTVAYRYLVPSAGLNLELGFEREANADGFWTLRSEQG